MNCITNFSRPVLDVQATGRNHPTIDNLIVRSELFGVPIDEIVQRKSAESCSDCKLTANTSFGMLTERLFCTKVMEMR